MDATRRKGKLEITDRALTAIGLSFRIFRSFLCYKFKKGNFTASNNRNTRKKFLLFFKLLFKNYQAA